MKCGVVPAILHNSKWYSSGDVNFEGEYDIFQFSLCFVLFCLDLICHVHMLFEWVAGESLLFHTISLSGSPNIFSRQRLCYIGSYLR